ncbi:MAG TPA: DUF4349 domain-containing protein [Candidatus Limnocylindrales bacterium]|nr:DUF4349 domain-containing protein [Candidatus Limnocylindrales bacterium]
MRRNHGLLVLLVTILVLLIGCTGAAGLPDDGSRLAGVPAATDAPAQDPTSADDAAGEVRGPNDAPVLPGEQLIVYTGRLDLEVTDLAASVSQAGQIVNGFGGHIASSEASNTDNSQSASVTYRIPAPRWAETVAALRAIGARIVNESTESEDVTAQVVDLDARIANLQATESALQGIMVQATTITDVLKVQDELTAVRGDIESLTAQRDLLANRAALSTLTVTFNVPVAAASVASTGWSLGTEIDNAVAALVRLGQGFASLVVWLAIVVLPVMLPLAAIVLLGVWLRRRWQAGHPEAPIV